LVQYTYSQLQVLLPGETNAPGTALGYVGSPAPISVAAQGSTPTTITVNTVDANFNIVNVSDTIKLTTSDNSAYLPAANVTTVNGTAVFSGANGILFQSAGSQTVTASDLSTANIPNGTSAAVTVGP
jgi:adhesin/invasin